MASTASESIGRPPLEPRTALLSIVGFWLFYYLTATLRAAALGFQDQFGMLGRRALVTLAGMAITWVIYRLLRSMDGSSTRRLAIAAGLAAVPAAFLYSTVNHYAFDEKRFEEVEPTRRDGIDAMVEREVAKELARSREAVGVQLGEVHDDPPSTPFSKIADQAANGYFFFVAWAALYLALSYAAQVRVAEREAARLRAAAQAAELRALRYQVNPHFLFNTLNSLSSLVLSDRRDEAERMIMNLATFFRTSLAGDPTEDVRLDEELRLQRLYLDIEAVRFPDRLTVLFDVGEELLGVCVPGLILQPLVENAIRHGVAGSRRPVTLRISARAEGRCLKLRVEDDGDGTAGEHVGRGHGVGLRNVRDRLAARFGSESDSHWGRLPNGGFAVTLYMPIVRHDC